MDENDDRDPLEGLEDRLQSHTKAFESLLALTPARDHYGSQVDDGRDPSEQWKRKKQTKEEQRAAKKAKLDPANERSALDVLNEREAKAIQLKRKRENGEPEADDVDESDSPAAGVNKRRRSEEDAAVIEARKQMKAEKRKQKRQKLQEKAARKKAKLDARKAAKRALGSGGVEEEAGNDIVQNEEEEDNDIEDNVASTTSGSDKTIHSRADMDKMDTSGLLETATPEASSNQQQCEAFPDGLDADARSTLMTSESTLPHRNTHATNDIGSSSAPVSLPYNTAVQSKINGSRIKPNSKDSAVDVEELRASELVHTDGHQSDASSAPTSPLADSPGFDLATDLSGVSSSTSLVPPSHEGDHDSGDDQNNKAIMPEANALLSNLVRNEAVDSQSSLQPATEVPERKLNGADAKHLAHSGNSSPKIRFPDIDKEELQERLRCRIAELRAKRKADGPDGQPARSRQELLEQRRKKNEQRKASKKERIKKAKEEEERKREEQLHGSHSPLSADLFSPRSPLTSQAKNNFAFSRLAFDDGTAADASLTTLQDPLKKKGPQDARTALQAAENRQSRLAGYDAEKRADIAEKDMWLNAKKRAHGERAKDDTNLLKKALKRKEKQKGKSEKEWKEREEAIVKGREMKQKKRETNLAKRREEKGGSKNKKKPGGGGSKSSGGKKSQNRPGFEGRFRI